ncbi:MAG: response regulator transcription factor [Gemmatimonadales bacterium]|nr:response regulator transcription factor [Gemmatimonadales bacterium]
MTILIVEDDADLAFGLRNNLEIEGYQVEVAADGPSGLAALGDGRFELVILDLMMPGIDGLRLLRTMRDRGDRTPVLILTARGQEEDKVRGLKLGADDYVTKPFGVLELLARIEALLRRARPGRPVGAPTRFGETEVDPATRQVRRGGMPVGLSPKEFDLLWALLEANGAVLSRPELMQQVWGYQATVLSRTVDTHIAELRRKLEEDPAEPRHLLTVRKAGYRLARYT